MEGFFQESSSVDAESLRELLLRRYHDMDYIMKMELLDFISFCKVAVEKDREERLHQEWCAMLPQFIRYVPFREFYDMETGANIDWRPAKEIIAEIEAMHERSEDRGSGDF